MAQEKPERVKSFRVINGCEQAFVLLINPDKGDENALAIREAARIWEMPWGKIAALCEVVPVAEQWRCVCRICGRQFAVDSVTSECPACVSNRRQAIARYMKSRSVDRRINAKN